MGNKHSGGEQSTSDDQGLDLPSDGNAARLKLVFQSLLSEDEPDGTSNIQTITKEKFLTLFPLCQQLGDLLYNHIVKSVNLSGNSDDTKLTIATYINYGQEIVSLIDRTKQLEYFFSVMTKGQQKLTKADAKTWLHIACQSSWACVDIDTSSQVTEDDVILKSMLNAMMGKDDEIDWQSLKIYFGMHCGHVCQGMQVYAAMALLGKNDMKATDSKEMPEVVKLMQTRKTVFNYSMLWSLTATLKYGYFPTAGGDMEAHEGARPLDDTSFSLPLESVISRGWHQLYNSNDQGLSLNRFQHHVFEYKSSTVLLLTFEKHMFCIATDEEWKDDTQKWGGVETCLLQILPKYKVIQGGAPMVYLNLSNKNLPRCLRVGKSPQSIVLEIDTEFSKVKQFGTEYDLHIIEVWGCGGSIAKEAQAKQKQWEIKDTERHKNRKFKVSKEEWADSPDRQLLEMGGVKTKNAER